MELQELISRSEIIDVLARYAHGADRRDWAIVRSCYHDDAYDDHGIYKGGMDGLMTFLAKTAGLFRSNSHLLSNYLIEVDEDTARTQTYCFAWYRRLNPSGVEYSISQGLRYLDRFERRDRLWAITHRVVILDWEHVFEPGPTPAISDRWCRGQDGGDDVSSKHFKRNDTLRQPAEKAATFTL